MTIKTLCILGLLSISSLMGAMTQPKKAAIFDLISKGQTKVVEKLVKKDQTSLKALDDVGATPLQWAIEKEAQEIVQILINEGANVNAQCLDGGHTPLHYAARMIDLESTVALIKAGARVDLTDQKGHTPLHIIASHVLISPNGPRYQELIALRVKTLKICRALIQAGADINAKNYLKQTPIHMAIVGESKEMIRELISRGASMLECDEDGNTVLHAAATRPEGHLCVNELIDAGAQINAQNQKGYTPVMFAIVNKKFVTALTLIDRGAEVDRQTRAGQHGLHAAIMATKRPSEMPQELVTALSKSNINLQDAYGLTALHAATMSGETEWVRLLLQNDKIALDIRDIMGNTPIHSAVVYEQIDCLNILITDKKNTMLLNKKGQTALEVAIFLEKSDHADILYEAMKESSAIDINGRTASQVAKEYHDKQNTPVAAIATKLSSSTDINKCATSQRTKEHHHKESIDVPKTHTQASSLKKKERNQVRCSSVRSLPLGDHPEKRCTLCNDLLDCQPGTDDQDKAYCSLHEPD